MDEIRSLWHYRGFIFVSVIRDLQKIYQGGALLGRSLLLARPLALVAVYTFVFSHIMAVKVHHMQDGVSYAIFLCSGIFTWFYFSEVVTRGTVVFVENPGLIKQSRFPRLSLPIITLFSHTINFALVAVIFLLFLLINDHLTGWALLGFIPLLMIQQLLAFSLGVFFGIFNIFFRDIGQLIPIGLQCWFWLTPIVYPLDILPENYQRLIQTWNPMAPIVNGYHAIVLDGVWPQWGDLGVPVACSLIALGLGWTVFRIFSKTLADEV